MVEWKHGEHVTCLVVDGLTFATVAADSDHFDAWARNDGSNGGGKLFATEAAAAQHVVKHAWLAGHIVGAPTLSDGTVLRLDVESLRADLATKEAETNALRELLAVAVEMEGGDQ